MPGTNPKNAEYFEYSININPYAIQKSGLKLSFSDAAVLSWMRGQFASKRTNKKLIDNDLYIQTNREYVLSNLPMLKNECFTRNGSEPSKSTLHAYLRRKFKRFTDYELLERGKSGDPRHAFNQGTWFKQGLKFESIFYSEHPTAEKSVSAVKQLIAPEKQEIELPKEVVKTDSPALSYGRSDKRVTNSWKKEATISEQYATFYVFINAIKEDQRGRLRGDVVDNYDVEGFYNLNANTGAKHADWVFNFRYAASMGRYKKVRLISELVDRRQVFDYIVELADKARVKLPDRWAALKSQDIYNHYNVKDKAAQIIDGDWKAKVAKWINDDLIHMQN